MMGEVVDDGDAALDAAHFHPPLDALERLQAFLDLFRREAAQARDHRVGERVQHVVAAGERGAEAATPSLPTTP
jgi:hypothetical protein